MSEPVSRITWNYLPTTTGSPDNAVDFSGGLAQLLNGVKSRLSTPSLTNSLAELNRAAQEGDSTLLTVASLNLKVRATEAEVISNISSSVSSGLNTLVKA